MLDRRTFLLTALGAVLLPLSADADEVPGLKLEGAGQSLLLTAQDILEADAQPDGYGRWLVLVRVTRNVAEELEAVTIAALGQPLAISFRGEVISEPVVHEPLAGGSFQISGLERITAERIAAFAKKGS